MGANVDHVTTWWGYVRRITHGASQKEIAQSAGVTQPTVSRWVSGEIERASADVAVKLATKYGASVGEALVAAGVLDAEHLPVTIMRTEDPSDDELLTILARRLDRDRKDGTDDGQPDAPAMTDAGETPAPGTYGLAARKVTRKGYNTPDASD